MNKFKLVIGQIIVVTCFACAHKAFASADLFSLSLEELVQIEITSASKATDAVRDIPASVTILTREDIALSGYTTLEELLINVPGFYHIDTYEDFLIGVRGTVGGSLAFLVNGTLQHPTRIKSLSIPDRSRTNIPIESIDRIEIVRGPSSVTYGNNAFLGSINIVTNDIDKASGGIVAGVGSNGTSKLFARVGQEYDEGYSVFNLGMYQSDGISGKFADLMTPEQLEQIWEDGMLEKLDGTLAAENLSAELSGSYRHIDYGFRYSSMNYGFYVFTPGYDTGPQIKLTNWHGSFAYTHSIQQQLKAKISFVLSQEDYLATPDFVLPDMRGNQFQSSDRAELEILLSEESYQRLQWVAGLNMRTVSNASNRPDFPDLGFFADTKSGDANSQALFFNLDYSLSDALSLTGGYRFTFLNAYDVKRKRLEDGEIVHENYQQQSRTDDNVRLAAVWSVNANNMLKLIYGTATQDNREISLPEPELIESLELNYLYLGQRNTLSFSLFQNDIHNVTRRTVRFDEQGGVVTNEENESEWLTQGAEMIFTARPFEHFSAELSGVYQTTEDRALDDTDIDYSPQGLLKLKLGYGFSSWVASASYAYVGEMLAGYSLDYREDTLSSSPNYFGEASKSYDLMSLNLRYQRAERPWFLNLHAFNLRASEFRYPANELANFELGASGPGRQIVLTFGIDLFGSH
ncbi:Outer membrane receptor proteins, mostly Fe transport [Alteromonadaceae bacterium Bs31]|nr:Outer membrane receptor proteins, mostly Fe transport [Alteromonadaceae bacterium Bs31]